MHEDFPVEALAFAVDQANDMVMVTTAELEKPHPLILYVNPAFERLTGYKRSEVIGKSPRLLQGAKSDKNVLKRAKKALLAKESFRDELTNYRKDGTTYTIEWHIAPVRKNGKIVNWISVQRDISLRKKAEESLKQSKSFIEKEVNMKTKEISRLNDELSHYAKRLEQRLKRLEEGIGLSENERNVLVGMVADALAGDGELASSLKMKRSTVTAIRNRLKRKEWYTIINIPDYAALGFEVIGVRREDVHPYERTHKILKEKVADNNVICSFFGKDEVIRLLIYEKFSDVTGDEELYPLNASTITWMDFTRSLIKILGKGTTKEEKEKNEMKKIDKRIVLAMVKHPMLGPRLLAEIVNLSIPHVTRVYKSLLQSGMVKRAIVPNMKKLKQKLLIAERLEDAFFSIAWQKKSFCLELGAAERIEKGADVQSLFLEKAEFSFDRVLKE